MVPNLTMLHCLKTLRLKTRHSHTVGCALFSSLALAASACSWGRFDDVTSNAPVVLLNKPDALQYGFGVTLATTASKDRSILLSTGNANRSAGALFDIADDAKPGVDATSEAYCDGKNPCYLASSVAALARWGSNQLCFALGIGKFADVSGVFLRCDKGQEAALEVPEAILTGVVTPILKKKGGMNVAIQASPDAKPALIVGVGGTTRLAWYYADDAAPAWQLEVPGTSEPGYGQAVAALKVGSDTLLAVSAPASEHVWLFKDAGDGVGPLPLACLVGGKDFGRTLSTGFVTKDDTGELLIADSKNVYVFDGPGLAALELPLDPTLAPACAEVGSHAALLTKLSCGTTGEIEGCGGASFGAALAVGDLDADGDGEVLVGAPKMQARDVPGAGAVLVYDVEGKSLAALADALFLSSAEDFDGLGSALAAPRVGKRDIVAAGAPGNAKTALFYCSALGGASARCE